MQGAQGTAEGYAQSEEGGIGWELSKVAVSGNRVSYWRCSSPGSQREEGIPFREWSITKGLKEKKKNVTE